MKRWAIGVLLVAILVGIGYVVLRDQSVWAPLGPGRVKAVPQGDQEIAWIAPATSGENWERLVKAVRVLAEQWAVTHGGEALSLDTERCFLPLTADVPEIGLRFPKSGTLWIRWYKLSGGNDAAHWVASLQRRATPPLALVGGDTSDRALALAEILQRVKVGWSGAAPLFLITTATAERYLPPGRLDLELKNDDWPRLMAVYPGRTFRFAFTNTRMVEAVLDFVQSRPNIWTDHPKKIDQTAPPFALFTLTWLDDGYSKDLAYSFQKLYGDAMHAKFGKDTAVPSDEDFISYSVGDYYQPNPREEMAVGLFLANNARRDERPQLLVLPTGTQRARRFLRTLCRRAPSELKNIVVANGDSISFNSLYRDRDLAWNVQDVPVPLIGFSHRNPIDPATGFGAKDLVTGRVDNTSTQDLLLYRDLVEAVVFAAFQDGTLLANSDFVLERLKGVMWRATNVVPGPAAGGSIPFFDAEGNRSAGTGEHVVWLKPSYDGTRILPRADLSVYRAEVQRKQTTWQDVGLPLTIFYDRASEQGAVHDAR